MEKLEEDPEKKVREVAFTLLKKWGTPEALTVILQTVSIEEDELLKEGMIQYLEEHQEENSDIPDILSKIQKKENAQVFLKI